MLAALLALHPRGEQRGWVPLLLPARLRPRQAQPRLGLGRQGLHAERAALDLAGARPPWRTRRESSSRERAARTRPAAARPPRPSRSPLGAACRLRRRGSLCSLPLPCFAELTEHCDGLSVLCVCAHRAVALPMPVVFFLRITDAGAAALSSSLRHVCHKGTDQLQRLAIGGTVLVAIALEHEHCLPLDLSCVHWASIARYREALTKLTSAVFINTSTALSTIIGGQINRIS
eukprot:3917150-Prymnesium_polylepis.1